jgi:hypothetical protein
MFTFGYQIEPHSSLSARYGHPVHPLLTAPENIKDGRMVQAQLEDRRYSRFLASKKLCCQYSATNFTIPGLGHAEYCRE